MARNRAATEPQQVKISAKTVAGRNGQQLVTTGNDEWYTPAEYTDLARQVMGGIDLDPASCAQANETVCAERYYTKENDGLGLDWYGRVWCNPPYGRLASVFTQRLLEDYRKGSVVAGVILVNSNALGAKWGQIIWEYDLVCSPDRRIHFLNPLGERTSSTHGSLIAYVGPDMGKFAEVFSALGAIVRRYDVS